MSAAHQIEHGDEDPSAWHLDWKHVDVQGRTAGYGEAGTGLPVVFLHGFGLRERTYKRALRRLVQRGLRVLAPSLPGFGDTAALPRSDSTLPGYADWVQAFLEAVDIDGPVPLVGHSFGGGVAIRTAYDHPDRVRLLVLINSVGGGIWQAAGLDEGDAERHLAERPLWHWGFHAPFDVARRKVVQAALPVILTDAARNLARNPRAFVRAGRLARTADLRAELATLKERRLPVVVLWGTEDKILPVASLDALVEATGSDAEVIEGSHAWLLADPDAFGEVMTNVLAVAEHEWEREQRKHERRRRLRPRQLFERMRNPSRD